MKKKCTDSKTLNCEKRRIIRRGQILHVFRPLSGKTERLIEGDKLIAASHDLRQNHQTAKCYIWTIPIG